MEAPAGFASLGLCDRLLSALAAADHHEPTPIQARAIPPALKGRDVTGVAQTGTGKTAAFALPVLQRLLEQHPSRPAIRALVLSPTRELAAQIGESFARYGRSSRLRHAVIFGGVGQGNQVRQLRAGVDVLIATPGRLEDLIDQGYIDLSQVEVLVLDEVDRMLDQGFLPAVRRVARRVPKERQTLLFSATMPTELRQLAQDLQDDPVEVSAAPVASTPDAIEQGVYFVQHQQKRALLEQLLQDRDLTRALVFTKTKRGADRVVKALNAASLGAEALHGGKSQNARERALAAFRQGRLKVLVATDLAARGLHVDGISHVIQVDLPMDIDSYVHRIGRTARAGAKGKAVALCSPDERDLLRRIERLIQQRLPVLTAPQPLAEPRLTQPAAREAVAASPATAHTRPVAPSGQRPQGPRPQAKPSPAKPASVKPGLAKPGPARPGEAKPWDKPKPSGRRFGRPSSARPSRPAPRAW